MLRSGTYWACVCQVTVNPVLVQSEKLTIVAGGKIDLYSLPGSGTVLEVWMPAPVLDEVATDALGDELSDVLDFPMGRSA